MVTIISCGEGCHRDLSKAWWSREETLSALCRDGDVRRKGFPGKLMLGRGLGEEN